MDWLFEICNHHLKSLHVLGLSETARRDAGELLLLAAMQAKANGSYATALYYTKSSMFLMRLEKVAPVSENSHSASASELVESEVLRNQTNNLNIQDTSEQVKALEQALQMAQAHAPAGQQQLASAVTPPLVTRTAAAAARSSDNSAAGSAPLNATQQRLLEGARGGAAGERPSGDRPQVGSSSSTALVRSDVSSTDLAPVSAESGSLLSSRPLSGDEFNSAATNEGHARADIAGKGHTVEEQNAVWAVRSDYLLLYELSFLRGELEYLCGHHRRSFLHFQLCLQHTTHVRQQIACFKQLIRLKTIGGEYQLALILGVRALSLLRFELHGLSLDGKQWSCDASVVHHLFEQIMATVRGLGCENDIARLLTVLPLCNDARMTMVSDVLVELIFPAHFSSQLLLQFFAFTTVAHSLRYGLSRQEAFAFCMFGASLLARSVQSDHFWAKSAQQWGALGLNLCLRFNHQPGYARSLLANALYINSFTGHLERSLRELRQAIYIGSLTGDLQFVTQSSLAIVLLQQYTAPLTSWKTMVQQTEGENKRSLQDRSVARYCQGMLLLIDSLQGERGEQNNAAAGGDLGAAAIASQRRRQRATVPRCDPDAYSPAERQFVSSCQEESSGAGSVHLSLFCITKAKLQYLFRAPGAAIETLKLVSVELVVSYPEIVTYLLIQSLAYLALIREYMDGVTAQRAAMRARNRRAVARTHGTATVPEAAAVGLDDMDGELPEAYAATWRQVNANQVSLARYSTSNPRDFHCTYLLVRAEMAYTNLLAFDCGFVLESVGELSSELLPPTEGREQHTSHEKEAVAAGNAERAAALADGSAAADDKQNTLGDINRKKAKQDRREAAAAEKTKDAAKQSSKAVTAASARGDTDPAKSGAAGQLTDKQLLTNVAKSRSRIRTLLTEDPFLRDQLIARIFTVYSSAAALTISSRSSSNFRRDHEGSSSSFASHDDSKSVHSSHASHASHSHSHHSRSAESRSDTSSGGSEESQSQSATDRSRRTAGAGGEQSQVSQRSTNSARSAASSAGSAYSDVSSLVPLPPVWTVATRCAAMTSWRV